MSNLSPFQRRMVVEQLTAWLGAMVGDERNHVEFALERGIDRTFGDDLATPAVAPNSSCTLVVRINGGARSDLRFSDDQAA